MQLLKDALTLNWVDWTRLRAATPVAPIGVERATPRGTSYKVARGIQGITPKLSLTCSNTATAELTIGFNASPIDSTTS